MINKKKLISIVTPCWNENIAIYECHNAIKKLFQNELKNYNYEHIFCDNCSKDDSEKILREISGKDKNVKVILNAKNFGEEKSTFNGIKNTSGDAVVLYFPADLQDPPELIVEFVKIWEKGVDFVYGQRDKRHESKLMTLIRKFFYKVIYFGSSNIIPDNVSDYQLADRKIVNEMLKVKDETPFLRSLGFFITDNHKGINYSMRKRKIGISKYNLSDLLELAVNGVISVSTAPFRIILYAGVLTSIVTLLICIYFIIDFILFDSQDPKGIPFLIVSLFFFSGLQLLLIGIVGEYLVAIHTQIRKKPFVFVREKINF